MERTYGPMGHPDPAKVEAGGETPHQTQLIDNGGPIDPPGVTDYITDHDAEDDQRAIEGNRAAQRRDRKIYGYDIDSHTAVRSQAARVLSEIEALMSSTIRPISESLGSHASGHFDSIQTPDHIKAIEARVLAAESAIEESFFNMRTVLTLAAQRCQDNITNGTGVAL